MFEKDTGLSKSNKLLLIKCLHTSLIHTYTHVYKYTPLETQLGCARFLTWCWRNFDLFCIWWCPVL